MTWEGAFDASGYDVLSRSELLAAGATGRSLAAAVRAGFLVRNRRDHYTLPTIDPKVGRALRVGGRLTCVNALESYGVFAYDTRGLHVHVPPNSARLRSPRDAKRRLGAETGVVVHWTPLIEEFDGDRSRVGIRDALVHAAACQEPWHAIASLDSAWHQGLIDPDGIAEVFARLPKTQAWMRDCLDPRAEAGQESVLRMIVRQLGYRCVPQVRLRGLGRVDLLVEDVLVLEADSRAHHDSWAQHIEDRRRDLAAANLGLGSLRPAYQHTMHHPDLVADAIRGLVESLTR